MIQKIQREGRICPRYTIPDEDDVAAELCFFAARIGADHSVYQQLFALHTEGQPTEVKIGLFRRVLEVVSDPGIAARIKAARERALKEP